MKEEDLYERIYKKYDGRYGSLVGFTVKLIKTYKENITSQAEE